MNLHEVKAPPFNPASNNKKPAVFGFYMYRLLYRFMVSLQVLQKAGFPAQRRG